MILLSVDRLSRKLIGSSLGLLNLDIRKDCVISLFFDGDSQKIDKAVRYLLDEKII